MESVFLLVAYLLTCNSATYASELRQSSDDGNSFEEVTNIKQTDLYQAASIEKGSGDNNAGRVLDQSMGTKSLDKESDKDELLSAFRLTPHAAKSVLRPRRGIWWWEENEEEEEARTRERNREADALAAHLARVCPGECWGPYGPPTACSAPCGNSGITRQYRAVAPSTQCVSWVASNGCPGSSTRSNACNRFCYNGGTPRATSCSCPAGYTDTCCGTRVTCGNPGAVSHGTFVPGGTSHFYGVTVTYSCELGYRLQGSTSRVCQNSGRWSNAVPTCQLIDCGDPGTPTNSHRTGSSFTFGATLAFTCNTGYRISGNSIRQCQESGRWSGTQPTCTQITCPAPEAPMNGAVATPGGLAYDQTATYICDEHYYLSGAATRSCLLEGTWSGSAPICNAILCDKVAVPAYGSVTYTGATGESVMHGGSVTYACQNGYLLTGATTRICSGIGPSGSWTNNQPTCQPVNCGDPGTIENGVRSDTGFVFQSGTVTYQCLAGYYLTGTSELRCQASAVWSANKPTCTACPLNTFKPGTNGETGCQSCPANSHTAAVASSSLQQCECDFSYEGANGGPCTLITCEPLLAPEHGYIDDCTSTYNQVCHMDCDEGYIRSDGNDARTCQLNQQWSGSQLVCTACGNDTYKASATSCMYCPEDSHTEGEANALSGCICDDGFEGPGGGPCQDVNECESDNSGCQQTCENEIGSYRCTCTLPGYIQDAQDPTRCAVKNQCPDLEPIENGGFVCVMESATSTQRCQPKCNYGYEHFVRPNGYEECGPSTNWVWSSDLRDVPLFPCQETFFPGITLEADMFYFMDDCESLTESQRTSIKVGFLEFLTERGVCNSANYPCEVEDCTVECGATQEGEDYFDFFGRRRRRQTTEEGTGLEVRFAIKVNAIAQADVDCDAVCDRQGASERYCNNSCRENYLANVSDVITFQVHQALSSSNGRNIHVGELTLVPEAGPVVVQLPPSCDEGMVEVGGSCAPCPAGSYKSSNSSECLVCPPRTFQPVEGQMDCRSCIWANEWGVVRCKNPLEVVVDVICDAVGDVGICDEQDQPEP